MARVTVLGLWSGHQAPQYYLYGFGIHHLRPSRYFPAHVCITVCLVANLARPSLSPGYACVLIISRCFGQIELLALQSSIFFPLGVHHIHIRQCCIALPHSREIPLRPRVATSAPERTGIYEGETLVYIKLLKFPREKWLPASNTLLTFV